MSEDQKWAIKNALFALVNACIPDEEVHPIVPNGIDNIISVEQFILLRGIVKQCEQHKLFKGW